MKHRAVDPVHTVKIFPVHIGDPHTWTSTFTLGLNTTLHKNVLYCILSFKGPRPMRIAWMWRSAT
jgi:hypothetical protein